MKKLMEVISSKLPKTAREFMGFPIHLEEREIHPVEDDRIMCDGRPAYAWWNEIQMLRSREPELQKQEMAFREKAILLRITDWCYSRDMLSNDTFLRIRQTPLTALDPIAELLNNPEKYITVEKR